MNQTITLGFGPAPRRRTLYAARKEDCLWYFWNFQKEEHIPIEHDSITGYIAGIGSDVNEYKGKKKEKLLLNIDADRPYCIKCGLDTTFAHGLLLTLSNLTEDQIRRPLTIAVEAGDDEKVLLSRVYDPETNEPFIFEYPDNPDWSRITKKAFGEVLIATGTEALIGATQNGNGTNNRESRERPAEDNHGPHGGNPKEDTVNRIRRIGQKVFGREGWNDGGEDKLLDIVAEATGEFAPDSVSLLTGDELSIALKQVEAWERTWDKQQESERRKDNQRSTRRSGPRPVGA